MPARTTAVPGVVFSLRGRARRWLDVGRLLRRVSPTALAAVIALHLTVGLLPVGFILATSQLMARLPGYVGGTGAQDAAAVTLALALSAGAFVVLQLLAPFQSAAAELVAREVDGVRIADLMSCVLSRLPAARLEQQDVLDTLAEARGGFDLASPTPGEAAAGALALIARYTQLAGAAVMVAFVLGPVPALLVTVTALVIRYGQRGSLSRFGAMRATLTAARRRLSYLRRVAGGTALAKETRMLGLVPWLRERHVREAHTYLHQVWAGRRRLLFAPFIALAAIGLIGGGTALAVLGRDGAHGTISLLQLSAALQAVLIPMRFGVFFPESDMQTLYGMAADDALRRLEPSAAPGLQPGLEAGPRLTSGRCAPAAIHIEQAGFRYHANGPDVLDGLELELVPGTSTAVVGLNGAGKTTLVKLLARIHEPTRGRITVDGRDLAEIPAAHWHRRIAVIFQDFIRLPLTAAENVAIGCPDRREDTAALRAAAERAGVLELLDGLPHGLETVLSSQYEGGTDLSGGQWQRIALARAILALDSGASLLILDEPTAQLDVRAEAAFFDRFLELTSGVTSLIIAHRFSSVRRADRIVVLADGRVAESGTHEELMRARGRYAELFHTQAERFAEADPAPSAPALAAPVHGGHR